MTERQQWRTLDWLPNYEISEGGEVRRRAGGHRRLAGALLVGRLDQDGYRSHKLTLPDGTAKSFRTHRLVCEAFWGPCPAANLHCAHGDGDKSNNHFSNLRWATPGENNRDKIAHGTSGRGRKKHSGEVAFTAAEVGAIRSIYTGKRGEIALLARSFGLPPGTVWHICKNDRWFISVGDLA